jgi:ABC-type transport system substrate-binding protein
LLIAFILAGCTANDPPPAPLPQTAQPPSTYRIASPHDAITLDPAQANSPVDWWAASTLIFDQLYEVDAQGSLQPALASDWPQVSADGLQVTIPLRAGVAFHNGRTLTADDVKFSLERILQPETASWGAGWLMNIVGADAVANGTARTLAGVTTLGPLALQIRLKQPQAALPAILSMSALSIVPRQEVLIAGSGWGSRVVIGTGPYKLAGWQKGTQLRLERNATYFKTGAPRDTVEIALNMAAPVALEMWQKGEVDFALFDENAEEVKAIRDDATLAVNIRTQPSLSGSRILFNPANRYTADARVRQAIVSAIDPSVVYRRDAAAAPANGLLPPVVPQFDTNFKNPGAHDLSRAQALLAQAGYPNGIDDLKLISRESPEEVQALRDSLSAAGIRTQLISGEPAEIDELVQSGEVAIAFATEQLDFNDAAAAFASLSQCGNANTHIDFLWCNTDVLALLAEAERLPLNSAERTQLFRQVEDITLNQEISQFVLGWRQSFGLGREDNMPIHPVYGMPDLKSTAGAKP